MRDSRLQVPGPLSDDQHTSDDDGDAELPRSERAALIAWAVLDALF